jgi:hypothetical protein
MEHYVGLDVSLKLTAICIVDRTRTIVREGVVTSDPETIAAFIKSHAPHIARVGLEAGATSTWLWTELNGLATWSRVEPRSAVRGRSRAKSEPEKAGYSGENLFMCHFVGDGTPCKSCGAEKPGGKKCFSVGCSGKGRQIAHEQT